MKPNPGISVALAGNPNAGKTSLFNALTGARQHVGNYPGVTVERRVGAYSRGGNRFEVHDLPGTYSLTSFSPEERIAQDELLNRDHDVVVVVADSNNLHRSLVLLAQAMQVGANPVLCLNMADEAHAAGQQIDIELMQTLLGFPVVETVGRTGAGVDQLKVAITTAAESPAAEIRLVLGERLDAAVAAIVERLDGTASEPRKRNWIATKLLMGDPESVESLLASTPSCHGARQAFDEAARQRVELEAETGVDVSLFVTERYFGFVDGLLREVVRRRQRSDARAVSDRIDNVLAHPWFGLPLFAFVMYAIFWLTFTLGDYPMGWLEAGFKALAVGVAGLWPAGSESALKSLIVDGIIGGVGGVIVFLPNILLLFLGLAFLEDSGYLARAAFLMDRVMHRFGLHGKSFIPMMTGFGCSIPGIMATRTLENERDRLTTMLVLPLMSCGARLPIWMLLIPAFFPSAWRAPMLWLIYTIGIGLALALALVLRKTILRGQESPFVMELPPYRLPTLRAVIMSVTQRSWLYLRKAGTIILSVSIVMWLITAYPKADHYEIDAEIAAGRAQVADAAELAELRTAEDLEASIAGHIGRAIEPLVRPLGFDWKLATAMLGAFAAKEVFVAQLGIVYSLGEVEHDSASLRRDLRRDYPPLVGFCLMLFLLISAPCMSTIAVTRRESGSWKWAFLQLAGLSAVAYVITFTVFQIGRLFV